MVSVVLVDTLEVSCLIGGQLICLTMQVVSEVNKIVIFAIINRLIKVIEALLPITLSAIGLAKELIV